VPARRKQKWQEQTAATFEALNDMVSTPFPAPQKKILLVDDNDELRLLTKWFLGSFGYAVDSVRTAEEALTVFDPQSHALVLTDNAMPGMSGEEMASVIKRRSPETPILMHTGNPPPPSPSLDYVLQRPAHMLELKDAVDRLLTAK
jgi:CheY-like chemotaxis protein